MPSVSDKQARWIRWQYGKAQRGEKAAMSLSKLKEWAEADSLGKKMKAKP